MSERAIRLARLRNKLQRIQSTANVGGGLDLSGLNDATTEVLEIIEELISDMPNVVSMYEYEVIRCLDKELEESIERRAKEGYELDQITPSMSKIPFDYIVIMRRERISWMEEARAYFSEKGGKPTTEVVR